MDFAADWDKKDTALLGAALAGIYADVQSQKDLNRRGGSEANPLIGKNPSGQDLDRAGLMAALVGSGVATIIPPEWRKPALGAWAGLEAGLAHKNSKVNAKDAPPKDLMHSRLEGPLMMSALGALAGHLMDDGGVTVEAKKGPKGAIELSFGIRKDF